MSDSKAQTIFDRMQVAIENGVTFQETRGDDLITITPTDGKFLFAIDGVRSYLSSREPALEIVNRWGKGDIEILTFGHRKLLCHTREFQARNSQPRQF